MGYVAIHVCIEVLEVQTVTLCVGIHSGQPVPANNAIQGPPIVR